jgi:diadenosine tetraphosphate (Ap4A) HIT family hydrolase
MSKRLEEGGALTAITGQCCICGEIDSGSLAEPLSSIYGCKNRLCIEGRAFVVVPSVSPLREGHLLIFSRTHRKNMAAVNVGDRAELMSLLETVVSQCDSAHRAAFIFEHGVVADGQTACGIDHAHLHVIPLSDPEREALCTRLVSVGPTLAVGTISDLLFGSSHECPYLVYGHDRNSMTLVDATAMHSQHVRRLIGGILHIPEWDWRAYTGVREFQSTIASFR